MLTKFDLEAESSTYIGLIIYAIAYGDNISNISLHRFSRLLKLLFFFSGISLALLFFSVYVLATNPNISTPMRRFHIFFNVITIILYTLSFFPQFLETGESWIVHRNDPGGPPSYYNNAGTLWYSALGDSSHFIFIALTDVLYVSRRRVP
jgi:hypothetical protein